MIIHLGVCELLEAEIIHSIHPLTNHFILLYIWCSSSFLGPKSSTANISLIVRIRSQSCDHSTLLSKYLIPWGSREYLIPWGPRSFTQCIHLVIQPWGCDHPPGVCRAIIISPHISIDLSYITQDRDHPPRVSCVSTIWDRDHPPHFWRYTLIIRSWTDTHHLSWGRDHPPQTFHLSLSDHKAVIIHLAGCVSYSMGPKSSAPCIRGLIIQFHVYI